MNKVVPSLHVLGSRQFGGADQFYVRLIEALHVVGQNVIAVNRPGSPVAGALAERGIEQVHVPMANRWDIWSAWKIRNLLTKQSPCVVQTYMGRATRLTRAPKGVLHIARLGGFYKIDGYYRHAHAWVGNTKAICDYLVAEGLPSKHVFHIGNFVPEARSFTEDQRRELRTQWNIPEDAWVLFGLGRLIEKKGFQDVLAALGRLPQELASRPWVMLIAGDGEAMPQLKMQCEELELSGQVRWLGWQNPPDAWFDLADLVIVPSRLEPLGNVILEAWSYGKPVLSTASDGALELIRDEENGLVVPCAKPDRMADGVVRALTLSESERRTLGEAGYVNLKQKFGQQVIVNQYLDLYDSQMQEHFNVA